MPTNPNPNVICGANVRKGGTCANYAVRGRTRCRMHGGKIKQGAASPHFKHGRFSETLKTLGEDIDHRLADPGLVDARRSIAVQELVLARLHTMTIEKDSPEFRDKAVRLLKAYHQAEDDLKATALDNLGEWLEQGAEESKALVKIGEAAEALGRGQQRYWNTALAAKQAISVDELFGLLIRIGTILEESVGKDAARLAMARADTEVCGGALRIGGR